MRPFLDSLARLSGQDQGRVRDALSKAAEDHRRGGLAVRRPTTASRTQFFGFVEQQRALMTRM